MTNSHANGRVIFKLPGHVTTCQRSGPRNLVVVSVLRTSATGCGKAGSHHATHTYAQVVNFVRR